MLCRYQNDSGVLPQGAATSPIISNLICRALDGKLSTLAKKYKIKFTRYADDITFSSNNTIFEEQTFIDELKKVVESENFKINVAKVRLQNQYQRQVVTGLTVNKKVNVPQKFITDLDFQIKLFSKDPIQSQIRLEQNYTKRHRYGGEVPKIDRVIQGKLDFLKMVIGEDAVRYIRLAGRFLVTENEIAHKAKSEEDAKKEVEQQEVERVEKEFKEEFEKIDVLKTDEEVSKILLDIKLKINSYFNSNKDYLSVVIASAKNKFNEQIQTNQNKYLTYSLKIEDVQDPFRPELVHGYIIERLKTKLNSAQRGQHSPEYLLIFLKLFRDGSSVFKKLVHRESLSESYSAVVDNASYALSLDKKRGGVLKQEIPIGIFTITKTFIDLLQSFDKTKNDENLLYSDFFDADIEQNPSLIKGFTRCYRFSDGSDGVKMSEIIKSVFSNVMKNSTAIWYLNFNAEQIDGIFNNILTSTFNIAMAIENVLRSCKKYSMVGAVKFDALKKNNKVIFRITNLYAEVANKDSSTYLRDLGSDTKNLKTFLNGYCDLNVIASFKNGERKLSLIPSSDTEEVPEEDCPTGFTYEFVFYCSLNFLLIDNDNSENRYKKALNIREKLDLGDIFTTYSTFKYFENKHELTTYNAVFIHVNNPEYSNVRKYLSEKRTPFISFGGGQSFEKITPSCYTINAVQFYENLENYFQKIKETSDWSFSFWNNLSSLNTSEDVKDIKSLITRIKKQGKSINDNEVKQNIIKIIGEEISIPDFSNIRQLLNFIDSKITNE